MTIQQTSFEVDVEAALDLMPEGLTRTAPPYVRLAVIHYPESPVGAYYEARLMLGVRLNMTPGQYVAASVVTSEAARVANAQNWKLRSDVGDVSLTRTGATTVGTVRTPSGLVIRIASPHAQAGPPSLIRYDPLIGIAALNGSGPQPYRIIDDIVAHRAWLARETTVEYTGGNAADPWLRLRSTHPITCVIAEQDVTRAGPTA
jgi:hypothetical protein